MMSIANCNNAALFELCGVSKADPVMIDILGQDSKQAFVNVIAAPDVFTAVFKFTIIEGESLGYCCQVLDQLQATLLDKGQHVDNLRLVRQVLVETDISWVVVIQCLSSEEESLKKLLCTRYAATHNFSIVLRPSQPDPDDHPGQIPGYQVFQIETEQQQQHMEEKRHTIMGQMKAKLDRKLTPLTLDSITHITLELCNYRIKVENVAFRALKYAKACSSHLNRAPSIDTTNRGRQSAHEKGELDGCLPHDLLRMILIDYLDVEHRAQWMGVSKSWYRYLQVQRAEEHNKLVQELEMRILPLAPGRTKLKSSLLCGSRKQLHITVTSIATQKAAQYLLKFLHEHGCDTYSYDQALKLFNQALQVDGKANASVLEAVHATLVGEADQKQPQTRPQHRSEYNKKITLMTACLAQIKDHVDVFSADQAYAQMNNAELAQVKRLFLSATKYRMLFQIQSGDAKMANVDSQSAFDRFGFNDCSFNLLRIWAHLELREGMAVQKRWAKLSSHYSRAKPKSAQEKAIAAVLESKQLQLKGGGKGSIRKLVARLNANPEFGRQVRENM